MSARKPGLTELSQSDLNASRYTTVTPKLRNVRTPHTRTTAKRQSIYPNRPGSARNILRRLARATAATTQRRVATPTSAIRGKENVAPINDDEDVKDEHLRPISGFNIEESIEEDDSELPGAPTPSALLEASDDIEEFEATSLSNELQNRSTVHRNSEVVLDVDQVASEPVMPNHEDDTHHESTYLSERGRRAYSEERTRMSRYSFGSIRMSDFGSELEIRRESDRQQKLADLEAEDDYGGELVNDFPLGGETEMLKGLQEIPPADTEEYDEEPEDIPPFDVGFDQDESIQIDDFVVEESMMNAEEAIGRNPQPQLADRLIEPESERVVNQISEHQEDVSESRRQTLLESMIATAAERKPRKKKSKLNDKGNMVPNLPSSLMKRIVHSSQEKANKRKTAFGKDHIKALEQATEWFFEQASQDLEAYSSHGRRKKRIDADDVLLLMRRQRVLKGRGDLRKLAKDWLPRELLNELDLPDQL